MEFGVGLCSRQSTQCNPHTVGCRVFTGVGIRVYAFQCRLGLWVSENGTGFWFRVWGSGARISGAIQYSRALCVPEVHICLIASCQTPNHHSLGGCRFTAPVVRTRKGTLSQAVTGWRRRKKAKRNAFTELLSFTSWRFCSKKPNTTRHSFTGGRLAPREQPTLIDWPHTMCVCVCVCVCTLAGSRAPRR